MRNWLVLLFLLSFIRGFAQEGSVQGVVLEETARGKFKPIHLANVFWLGTSQGTTTDSNGVFTLPLVKDNNKLVITYLGFNPDTITVVRPDKVTIILKSGHDLKEVKIEYRSRSTTVDRMNTLNVQQISKKELFKAACCNLSESFETNPSVDVAFTDAITGTKQIQLLGLAGAYTQITQENIPAVRGLATNYGLEFIPGTWIESMQLAKGTGSVVNGFESITGQLNVELVKPLAKERVIINGYAAEGGRYESNVVLNKKLKDGLTTGLLLHGNYRPFENDNNKDGFLDNPLQKQYSLLNRWDYRTDKGFESQFHVGYTWIRKEGGQRPGMEETLANGPLYRVDLNNEHFETSLKTGYVFPARKYQSMGLQLLYRRYADDSRIGWRNIHIGKQRTYYANLIYQGIIGTTDHKFRTGFSYLFDVFSDYFRQPLITDTLQPDSYSLQRRDIVPGVFFEYTLAKGEKFSLISGLRADQHNRFGTFITPRLHMRYAPTVNDIFRISAGRGQRTAHIFADHIGLMASSRSFVISWIAYAARETAWNLGLNYTHNFKLDFREGYLAFDLYRTAFKDQVIADLDASAREVRIYNLAGNSISNSFQVEVNYELVKHLDVRLAYRYYDVKVDYISGTLERPMVARHRGFVNLAYETRNNWTFDLTLNYVGKKRVPSTRENPLLYQRPPYSDPYLLVNAQVTRKFGDRFEAYTGVENLTNYRQPDAIVAADEPNGRYFDSSLIWGPVFGRMMYAGFRYTIKDYSMDDQ